MTLLDDVRREIYSEYQHSGVAEERMLLRWYDMLTRYVEPPDPPLTHREVKLRNASVQQRAARARRLRLWRDYG